MGKGGERRGVRLNVRAFGLSGAAGLAKTPERQIVGICGGLRGGGLLLHFRPDAPARLFPQEAATPVRGGNDPADKLVSGPDALRGGAGG